MSGAVCSTAVISRSASKSIAGRVTRLSAWRVSRSGWREQAAQESLEETVIVRNGNGNGSTIGRMPRTAPAFTVTQATEPDDVEHEDGTAPAVRAIQSLTCSAFERASRIVFSHRLIA